MMGATAEGKVGAPSPPPFKLDPNQVIAWQPQEGPQTALIACPVFEVFFGGARGGGKTEASIGDWLEHSSRYGEAAVGIFVRRRFKQLQEVIARTEQIFPKLGARYHQQKAEWTMANGARLKFVYLERDSDADSYIGHSYTRVYIEEAQNFPSPGPINKLKGTLRSATGVPCGMRLTGNPGGVGHHWVKSRYITPCPQGYKIITEEEEVVVDGIKHLLTIDRVFIPSRIQDNLLLMRNDPTYILRLRQTGSEALVRAWLEGDWDTIEGAFFDEWDEEKHVLRTSEWLPRIPRDALRFRSFDWGSASPFSVGWYVVSDGTWGLPKGALLKYREWYGAMVDEKGVRKGLKMDNPMIAQGILLRERGERIRYGVADPSIYIRSGGPSIAEQMAVHGCMWQKADNKTVPGAEMMHVRLKGEAGVPMLYFLDCCEDTIRTIPLMQHDEDKPEEVDSDSEDHAYDETRYAIMSRPWVPRVQKAEGDGLPRLPNQLTINEIIAQRVKRAIEAQEF